MRLSKEFLGRDAETGAKVIFIRGGCVRSCVVGEVRERRGRGGHAVVIMAGGWMGIVYIACRVVCAGVVVGVAGGKVVVDFFLTGVGPRLKRREVGT